MNNRIRCDHFAHRRGFKQVLRWTRYSAAGLALVICIVVSVATAARSEVIIESPSNDGTVSGTVTIKAQVNQAWWSKLWIDNGGGPTAGVGNVTFQWDSTSVSDGSHVLRVDAYPSGKPANAADSITVVVNNGASSSAATKYFSTLGIGASLPDDTACANDIPWEPEVVSGNQGANDTVPTTAQLDSFRSNGYAANVGSGSSVYARVDGQYTGTTDMIFRWAACKWGIDEDLVRAQATNENWSWSQPDSGGDKRTSYSQCVNGSFTSLWDFECPTCCYQSWSIFQTKVLYNWMTWPMILDSTAFGADYHFASMRACMDGDLASYFAGRPANNGHTYAGDIAAGDLNTILWGCVGFHYSGGWYDGSSSAGAIWYMNIIKASMAAKTWKTRWPSVNWPD